MKIKPTSIATRFNTPNLATSKSLNNNNSRVQQRETRPRNQPLAYTHPHTKARAATGWRGASPINLLERISLSTYFATLARCRYSILYTHTHTLNVKIHALATCETHTHTGLTNGEQSRKSAESVEERNLGISLSPAWW